MKETKIYLDHLKKDQLREEDKINPEKIRPFNSFTWKLMLSVCVGIYGSYSIIIHLEESNGKLGYSSASIVFFVELFKLLFCAFMLIPIIKEQGFPKITFALSLPFAVPAVLYCINNNISIHLQLHMDPASYQVLSNLKILSTAAMYRFFLKRSISTTQWLALFLLIVAGVCNTYGGFVAKPELSSAGTIHVSLTGLVLMAIYCGISGLSGVYTEYILKDRYEMSIHIQNGLLYIFGIFLNGSGWIYSESLSNDPDSFNITKGFTFLTLVLIISQACIGLLLSAIMKHGNNITRLFIISCAMVVTTFLSILIFNLQLNFYFSVTFVLVLTALYLYHI